MRKKRNFMVSAGPSVELRKAIKIINGTIAGFGGIDQGMLMAAVVILSSMVDEMENMLEEVAKQNDEYEDADEISEGEKR